MTFPLEFGIEALNNIQQNVCNRHLMMTHGVVEIVVLKFSYIIRHGSDIITEYVNKEYLLTETYAHTNYSKKISNDQELIQSDPTSCPQTQKGNN